MGAQSDHESGFFEGDECVDDDEVEIIHEEINNPGGMLKPKGKIYTHNKLKLILSFKLYTTFTCFQRKIFIRIQLVKSGISYSCS